GVSEQRRGHRVVDRGEGGVVAPGVALHGGVGRARPRIGVHYIPRPGSDMALTLGQRHNAALRHGAPGLSSRRGDQEMAGGMGAFMRCSVWSMTRSAAQAARSPKPSSPGTITPATVLTKINRSCTAWQAPAAHAGSLGVGPAVQKRANRLRKAGTR